MISAPKVSTAALLLFSFLTSAAFAQTLPQKWQADRATSNMLSDMACEGNREAYNRLRSLAYDQGSAPAKNSLRWLLITKRCKFSQKDNSEANRLLEESAAAGYPIAKSSLGLARLYGSFGYEQDPESGKALLEEAINDGYAKAGVNLADQLISGERLEQDLDSAQTLLSKAEEQGVDSRRIAKSQGKLYESKPNPTREDLQKALDAYAKAGDDDAEERMAEIRNRLTSMPQETAGQAEQTASATSNDTASDETFSTPRHFAALSISVEDGGFGWSHDYTDEDEARARSKDECRSRGGANCITKLVIAGPGCGAYTYADGGSPYGWGVAKSRSGAEQRARQECNQRNGSASCTGGAGWICNERSENAVETIYEAVNDSGVKAEEPKAVSAAACELQLQQACANWMGAAKNGTQYPYVWVNAHRRIDFPGCEGDRFAFGFRQNNGQWQVHDNGWTAGSVNKLLSAEQFEKLKNTLYAFRTEVQNRFPSCNAGTRDMSLSMTAKAIGYNAKVSKSCTSDPNVLRNNSDGNVRTLCID